MNEDILRKISKLMALSDSASTIGNQAEAETAAAKVQELLMQYNLDISDVKNAEHSKSVENMVKGDILHEDLQGRHESDWVLDLYNVIAKNNLCSIIRRTGRKDGKTFHYLTLLGLKVNAEIVDYTVKQLVTRIRDMAKRAFQEYNGPTKRNTWIRGYLRGAVRGIDIKLKATIQEMQSNNENIYALIRTNELQLRETVAKAFPNLKAVTSTKLSGTDGFHKGREDGQNMSIHKGLNNTGTAPVLGKQNKQLS